MTNPYPFGIRNLLLLGCLALIGCSKTSDEFVRSGIANQKQHRYQEALADFEQALRLDTSNAQAYLGRAQIACRTGFTKPIGDDLGRYIDLTARNMGIAYVGRGITNMLDGNTQAALEDFDRAILVDPNNVQGFEFKEQVLTYRGDSVRVKEFLATLDPELLKKMRHPIPKPYTLY